MYLQLERKKLPYRRELLPKCVLNYLNYLPAMRGCSNNTLAAYASDLLLFFKFIKLDQGLVDYDTDLDKIDVTDINNDLIRSITEEDLISFINWTIQERNNVEKTRARKIACLRSFFRYLHKKAKIIDNNPATDLESPKAGKRKPIFLTYEESLALLNVIHSRNTLRDHCIITLFLNCGLRLSELCSINIMDIKDNNLSVIGKGNKERRIPLNDSCMRAIAAYLPVREMKLNAKKAGKQSGIDDSLQPAIISEDAMHALFVSERKQRIKQRTVQELVEKYVDKAGLTGRKYSPHKLRHTAATLSYKGGADILSIQQLLGHESISTTQIYVHLADDHVRTAVTANPLGKIE